MSSSNGAFAWRQQFYRITSIASYRCTWLQNTSSPWMEDFPQFWCLQIIKKVATKLQTPAARMKLQPSRGISKIHIALVAEMSANNAGHMEWNYFVDCIITAIEFYYEFYLKLGATHIVYKCGQNNTFRSVTSWRMSVISRTMANRSFLKTSW